MTLLLTGLSWLLVLWRHNWADCLCCEGTTEPTACAVKAQLSWLLVLWRFAWAHCFALTECLQYQMAWISHYFWSPTFYGSVPETYAEDASRHSTIQGAALTCTRRHSSSVHFPLSQSCVSSSIMLSILFIHLDISEPGILMLPKQIWTLIIHVY
jgi:hypothetical protein